MYPFASRLDRIQPSPTIKVAMTARALKEQGRSIINLGLGEPDFDTPSFIKQAAVMAMQAGETKYTPVDGTGRLKNAIRNKFKRDHGLEYSLDQLIVGTGAKQVLFNGFLATIEEGDEVIIPVPYWVSYPDIVNFLGGIPVFVSSTEDFKIDLQAFSAAITPKTKWVILNFPNNPSGAVLTKEDLEAIAAILKQHPHVWILCDDIYECLMYKGRSFLTLAQVAPSLQERILIINGVSKAFAMTGWRIGYGAGPASLIQAMHTLQSQSTSGACSVAQAAAAAALERGPNDFIQDWLAEYQQRRDYVVSAFNEMPGIKCRIPEGSFYAYPSCSGIIGCQTSKGQTLSSDTDFATYLLEEVGVAVVPGSAFGLSPYFRVSYATSLELLQEACRLIHQAVVHL